MLSLLKRLNPRASETTDCNKSQGPKTVSSARLRLTTERPQDSQFDRQFSLHYQPQYELCSGRMIAVEALLRSRQGLQQQSPMQQITAAECNGDIHELGQWIIRRALQQFQQIQQQHSIQRVAVNVSPQQLDNPDFVVELQHSLQQMACQGPQLELEITENYPLNHCPQLSKNLHALRAIGVRIVLDDFGTGYTSLPLLAELPIDGIKLDKLFCQQLDQPRFASIAESLIELGETLEIDVLMEGIAEPHLQQAVQQMGCRYGQGYYLARPQPLEQLLAG